MARTKKTVTTEEILDEPSKDQEIDYARDLKDKSIEEVALDTPEEETKIEKKAKELTKESPEEVEEIEFDPEKLKAEAIEEAEKRLIDKLKGSSPDETKGNIDEYQQWAEGYAASNGGKAPEWKDAFAWME